MPEDKVKPLTIREAVAASLQGLSERTREQVIEHFASKEAQKQASALVTGLDKLATLERDLNKIRPQNTMFDGAGQPIGEPTFTKAQIDDRKKLADQIEKLTRAINKADEHNDFGDLYNVANKGGNNNAETD